MNLPFQTGAVPRRFRAYALSGIVMSHRMHSSGQCEILHPDKHKCYQCGGTPCPCPNGTYKCCPYSANCCCDGPPDGLSARCCYPA
jgi:hypothetical protein